MTSSFVVTDYRSDWDSRFPLSGKVAHAVVADGEFLLDTVTRTTQIGGERVVARTSEALYQPIR
jgi:hypothetical protein